MKKTFEHHFSQFAAVILFLVAAFSLLAASKSSSLLAQSDPILPISNRWVLLVSAGAELFVSAALLLGKNRPPRLIWTAWLVTNLLAYRIGLHMAGASNFGGCLGNLTEWFTISPRLFNFLTETLLCIMLIGSYGLLFLDWFGKRKSSRIFTMAAAMQKTA